MAPWVFFLVGERIIGAGGNWRREAELLRPIDGFFDPFAFPIGKAISKDLPFLDQSGHPSDDVFDIDFLIVPMEHIKIDVVGP